MSPNESVTVEIAGKLHKGRVLCFHAGIPHPTQPQRLVTPGAVVVKLDQPIESNGGWFSEVVAWPFQIQRKPGRKAGKNEGEF